jgi:hypothetical protein
MYKRLQHYSVFLRVFFVALSEIAIPQPVPPCRNLSRPAGKLHREAQSYTKDKQDW